MLGKLFGGRLKYLRKIRNLTQAELAQGANIAVPYLSRIERGIAAPSFTVIERICIVLETDPANLFLFPEEEQDERLPKRRHHPDLRTSRQAYLPWLCTLCLESHTGTARLSKSLCLLLQCSPPHNSLPLDHFLKYIHEEDHKLFEKLLRTVEAGFPVWDFNFRVLRANGEMRQMLAHPEVGANGGAIWSTIEMVLLDITEWNQLQKMLLGNQQQLEAYVGQRTSDLSQALANLKEQMSRRREVECKLHLSDIIVAGCTEAMAYVDSEHICLSANSHIEMLWGIPANDLLGRNVRNAIPQKVYETQGTLLDRALGGETVREQLFVALPDMAKRFLDISIAPHRDGLEVLGVVVTARDMTDLKNCESDNQAGQAAIKAILAATRDSVLILDTEGRVIDGNEWVCRSLGVTRNNLLGKHVYDFLPADLAKTRKDYLIDSIRDKTMVRFQDGTREKYLEQTYYPVLDNDGEVDRVIIIARDVTDSKLNEERLRLDRRRFELLYAITRSSHLSENEITDMILDAVVELTRSVIGHVFFMTPDETEMQLQSCKCKTKEACTAPRFSCSIEDGGVWREAVRQRKAITINDYETSPYKRGLPEGHVPLRRYLSLPIFQDGRIVVVVGVGNKADEYHDDDKRTIELLVGAAWNVIRRKRDEQTVKESEGRYLQAFEAFNDGLWEYNPWERVSYLSPGYYTMLGYDVEEFSPKIENVESLMHPEDRGPVLRCVEETLYTGRPYVMEYRLRRKNGQWAWVFSRGKAVEFNDQGSPTRILGTHIDITSQKQAEQALRESGEQFKALVSAIPDCLAVIDRAYTLVWANAQCMEFFGEGMVGKSCHEVFNPGNGPCADCAAAKVFQHGMPYCDEHRVICKEGKPRYFARQFNVLSRNADGSIRYLLCVTRDISQLKDNMAGLQKAKAEAEEATRAKTHYMASISHDVRTPLNGALGMLQLLQMTPLNEEQRDYLDYAMLSTRNLLEFINQLLDLAKVESGRDDVVEQEFGLRDFLVSVLRILEAQAREKGLEWAMEINPLVPEVIIADQVKLGRILLNLVGNAVKFTSVGKIGISVQVLSEGRYIGKVPLRFSVTDTGPGIAEEMRGELFQPFVQLKTDDLNVKGSGLGLSIVKRLAELLGGEVTMRSDPGKGSAFNVDIGVRVPHDHDRDDMPEHVREESFRKREVPHSKTVLLVEDERIDRKALSKMVELMGYDAIAATNGAQALGIMAENIVDLVLMDVQIPVMNGMDTTRAIRSGGGRHCHVKVPIVAVTANAMNGDRERCLEAGMNDYLAKPVDYHALQEMIERHLHHKEEI